MYCKHNSLQDLSSTLNNKLSSSTSKINSELKQSSLFQQSKKETNISSSNFSSKFESSIQKNGVEDLSNNVKNKLNNNHHNNNNNNNSHGTDSERSEFGSFSLLQTPALLSGSKSSKTVEEERRSTQMSGSTEQLSAGRATYSTTIERSVNTNSGYSSLNKPHEASTESFI